jgi:tetratricopeptide (TPR) repeat protein
LQAKGEFALLNQNLTIAQDRPGQPVKRGTMAHDHHLYMLLADTAAQQHDENALRLYTPRLEELAARDNHQLYLGIGHRAWGVAQRLAGRYAEAAVRLSQALQVFNRLGTRWQAGRTLFEIGELCSAQGDQDKAREHFSLALQAFEEVKAAPDVKRARAALE